MSEFVCDRKGKKHKLLTNKVDFNFLMYSYVFEDLIVVLSNFVSNETFEKLQEISRIIDNEIGVLKCDEIIETVAVQYGYNTGDCENE